MDRLPDSAEDIDSFIVALPEKVFYPADAVDRISPTLFKFAKAIGLPPQKDAVIRYFITTASALRHVVRNRSSEFDPKLNPACDVPSLLAQFVWVVEIAQQAEWAKGQISARAILDATASLRESTPFWLIHSRSDVLGPSTVVGLVTLLAAYGLSNCNRHDRYRLYPHGAQLAANQIKVTKTYE